MPNFYHVTNVLDSNTKPRELPKGSTPNDFVKLFVKDVKFLMPTVCMIYQKGNEPFCLSRKLLVGNGFIDEWDNVVGDGEECYFVSMPMADPVTQSLLVSLAVSLVIGVATYLLTPKPNLNLNQLDTDQSPTYNLNQQGNKVRLNNPIPVHYGTMRVYPDVASLPFSRFVYPDKSFYKVALCVGQDFIEVSDVKIDDTPVEDFPWVLSTITISDGVPISLGGMTNPMITSKEVKNYSLDALSSNNYPIQNKPAVLRATDENVDISSPGVLIDGGAPVAAQQFLLFGQTKQSENGTWTYNSATTPMTRRTTMDAPAEFTNAIVPVTAGTFAGDSYLQTNVINSVGKDPVAFEKNITGTTGDWFILNDANDLSKVRNIYFDFIAPQGIYALDLPTVNKPNAVVAAAGNINIASAPVLIDGYPISNNDKILLFNQTNSAENGLYKVSNPSGSPLTRDNSMNTAGEFTDAVVHVNTGTYGGQKFRQTIVIVTMDVDPVVFVEYDTNSSFFVQTVPLEVLLQEIDDVGANIGPLIVLSGINVSGSSNRTLYQTISHTRPTAGRFKAKITRKVIPKYLTDNNYQSKLEWVGFRGEIDFTPMYLDKTFLTIEARASGRLNNSNIGIWNCLGKRRVDVYDFGLMTWSKIQSNSPIWAWYDMATNTAYGAGLATDRISLDNLEDIYDSINLLGLECNARFDTALTADECLQQIAMSMRCQVYNRAGLKLLARDEEKVAVSAFFNRDNMKEETLNIEWIGKSQFTPSWYRITYFDETTNKKETVDCVLPGYPPDVNILPEEIEFLTITNRIKAWQEGMFLAAQNIFRRKKIGFQTDMEGYIPTLLDKISISHPSLGGSQSGIVQLVSTDMIYLSEPIAFLGYATGMISFRMKDGTSLGPYMCEPGDNQFSVKMIPFSVNSPDYTLFPFVSEFDEPLFDATTFAFGVENSSTLAIVKSVRPSANNQCTVESVNHDPRVHTADKPVHLVPAYGEEYTVWPEFICDVENKDVLDDFGCIVNLATKEATVTFDFSGYLGYRVEYLFNNAGVENLYSDQVNPGGAAGTKINSYVYPDSPPSRVTIIPIIDIMLAPPSQEVLTDLTVVVPITLV